MTRYIYCLTLIWAFSYATSSKACEDLVSIDQAQVVDLLNVVRDEKANALDQFFAFETLMCSNQSGIRDLTLRTATQSNNPTVQGQVVLRALMEMESLFIDLREDDGLTKEQYDRIKARPSETLPIEFKDPGKACFSFHEDDECSTDSLMSVNGTLVTIRTRWIGYDVDGSFSPEGSKLVGRLTFIRERLTYPAEINLF